LALSGAELVERGVQGRVIAQAVNRGLDISFDDDWLQSQLAAGGAFGVALAVAVGDLVASDPAQPGFAVGNLSRLTPVYSHERSRKRLGGQVSSELGIANAPSHELEDDDAVASEECPEGISIAGPRCREKALIRQCP